MRYLDNLHATLLMSGTQTAESSLILEGNMHGVVCQLPRFRTRFKASTSAHLIELPIAFDQRTVYLSGDLHNQSNRQKIASLFISHMQPKCYADRPGQEMEPMPQLV